MFTGFQHSRAATYYIGCFNDPDSEAERDLEHEGSSVSTWEECQEYCDSLSYKYTGVRVRKTCSWKTQFF